MLSCHVHFLNWLVEEAWILLNPVGDSLQPAMMTRIPSSLSLVHHQKPIIGSNGISIPSIPSANRLHGYSRADICECEPVLASSVLRVLVRFCWELECVDTKSLTAVQLNCFNNTVKVSIFLIFELNSYFNRSGYDFVGCMCLFAT